MPYQLKIDFSTDAGSGKVLQQAFYRQHEHIYRKDFIRSILPNTAYMTGYSYNKCYITFDTEADAVAFAIMWT